MLGIHVNKQSSTIPDAKIKELHDAIIDDTDKLGINSVQICTYGPKYFKKNKLSYDKIKECTKDINLTVHSAYASTVIWKIDSTNYKSKESKERINMILDQLISCKECGAWGLVLHITKIKVENIVYVMKLLKPHAKKTGVKILLEMTASKSTYNTTYETPEKINNLIYQLGNNENWYGICVDSAHIWAAGEDIQSYKNMKDWFDRLTFKKKILLFHLNGNSIKRSSGKDKHAIAFGPDDVIWGKISPENSGVRAIVEFCKEYDVPMICEVNRGEHNDLIKSLEQIKKLLN